MQIMKQDITKNPVAIKKDNREYYKSLYTHKFDTLEEKDQVLQNYKCQNSTKMTQII